MAARIHLLARVESLIHRSPAGDWPLPAGGL